MDTFEVDATFIISICVYTYMFLVITYILVDKFCSGFLCNYLTTNDTAPNCQVVPRKIGILLYGGVIAVLLIVFCILCVVFKILSGAMIFAIGAWFFAGSTLVKLLTKVEYTKNEIIVTRWGHTYVFMRSQLVSIKKQSYWPTGSFRIELRFRTGIPLYFEQINYCGLEAMYRYLNDVH